MTEIIIPEGITQKEIQTDRLKMNVLFSGDENDIPVILLHGNFSSAIWMDLLLTSLPAGFRGIAPDMRGYGLTEDKIIDATRGMRNWSDDLAALMDTLDIEKAHLLGWSLGGGVLYRFIIDHPDRILSVTLENPVSPYGFGGTKGLEGSPDFDDFAGSGGGVVNATFVQLIKEGDRSTDDQNSPRNVINSFYYSEPTNPANEESYLTGALMEKMGDDRYPGDLVVSPNWPTVAPGVYGPINAGSPKYVIADVAELIAAEKKPPILWIRGEADTIVSDKSFFDIGALGEMGFVPGWPGAEIFPPQPMVGQTRAVLDAYAANGGGYEEIVIAGAGHGVHIQKTDEFTKAFHAFIKSQS